MAAQLKAIQLAEDVPLPKEFAEIVARLAHEGVPIRALARGFEYHVTPIREAIREAIADGTVLQMPADDWPPGTAPAARMPSGRAPLSNEQLSSTLSHLYKLTSKEADILTLLVRKPNAQTKEALLDFVYGGRDEPELKIIDVFICKIRKKLAKAKIEITTVWGKGYVLEVADRQKLSQAVTEFLDAQLKVAA